MKIPEGYQTVMPYLLINGADKFIDFTQKVFGAKLILKEMRDEQHIMHAEVNIGGSLIMFADSTEEFKHREATFMVYVNDADITFNKAVAEGAEVVRDISDQQYGRTGGVKDPFGITWWITSVI